MEILQRIELKIFEGNIKKEKPITRLHIKALGFIMYE
jgi:hypothetical protein